MRKNIAVFICILVLVFCCSFYAYALTKFQECDSYSIVEKNGSIFIVGFVGETPKYVKTTITGKTWSQAEIEFELITDNEKIVEVRVLKTKEFSEKNNKIFAEHREGIIAEFPRIYLKEDVQYGKQIDAVTGATPQIRLMVDGVNKVRQTILSIFADKQELKQAFAQRKQFE